MKNKSSEFSPLVSIIIPVFNGEDFIEECLESALKQTYRNIEIIVIDDGSTDRTGDICKRYPEVSYIKKENGGVGSALNRGLQEAKGEYISWLSHDDKYKPEKIQVQINLLAKLKNKNCIVWSNFDIINENSQKIGETSIENQGNESQLTSSFFPLYRGFIHGCTLLIPKELLLSNQEGGQIFDESLKYTQDYDLWSRIFPKTRLLFLQDRLISSRSHPKQGSYKMDNFSECSQLWINLMQKMSDKEILDCYESKEVFLRDLQLFLKEKKYSVAEQYLESNFTGKENRALGHLSHAKVSVLFVCNKNIASCIQTLVSILCQTENNLEILLIDPHGLKILDYVAKLSKKITYIGANALNSLNIRDLKGSFLAYVEAGEIWRPCKLEYQTKMMVNKGWKVSHSSSYAVTDKELKVKRQNYGLNNIHLKKCLSGPKLNLSTMVIESEFFRDHLSTFKANEISLQLPYFLIQITETTTIYGINKALTFSFGKKDLKQFDKIAFFSYLTKKRYNYLVENFEWGLPSE